MDARPVDPGDSALRRGPETQHLRSTAQNDPAPRIPVPLSDRIRPHRGARRTWLMLYRTILSSLLVLAVSYAAETPDVIYYNGRIVTLSTSQPQAQAVAIKGSHSLLIWSAADFRQAAGPATRQVALHGRTVL